MVCCGLQKKMDEDLKQQMKEKEYVENELSKLLETTLRLENELYSISQ
ncbi:MAG TPA: hypothetical protein VJ438_03325 [Candidatus Nanoarchaeia archaeon]|nr:hypothetical protein [Candidatus Nanoarchaeia archaeon]